MEDECTEFSLVDKEDNSDNNDAKDLKDDKNTKEGVEDKKQGEMKYEIEETPVWHACILLGLQVTDLISILNFFSASI